MEHTLRADEVGALVHGQLDLERHPDGIAPLRLPTWTRPFHADGGIDRMSAQGSGVQLRLMTAASAITLDATFTRTVSPAHPARPLSVIAETDAASCRVDLDEGDVLVEHPDRTATRRAGRRSHVSLTLGPTPVERLVTVWLPHTAATVLHALTANAPVHAAPADGPRWLHYGLSLIHI